MIVSQGQLDADPRLRARGPPGRHRGGRRGPEAPAPPGAGRAPAGATEENLERLGDLLREVRRQIRPLERQAAAGPLATAAGRGAASPPAAPRRARAHATSTRGARVARPRSGPRLAERARPRSVASRELDAAAEADGGRARHRARGGPGRVASPGCRACRAVPGVCSVSWRSARAPSRAPSRRRRTPTWCPRSRPTRRGWRPSSSHRHEDDALAPDARRCGAPSTRRPSWTSSPRAPGRRSAPVADRATPRRPSPGPAVASSPARARPARAATHVARPSSAARRRRARRRDSEAEAADRLEQRVGEARGRSTPPEEQLAECRGGCPGRRPRRCRRQRAAAEAASRTPLPERRPCRGAAACPGRARNRPGAARRWVVGGVLGALADLVDIDDGWVAAFEAAVAARAGRHRGGRASAPRHARVLARAARPEVSGDVLARGPGMAVAHGSREARVERGRTEARSGRRGAEPVRRPRAAPRPRGGGSRAAARPPARPGGCARRWEERSTWPSRAPEMVVVTDGRPLLRRGWRVRRGSAPWRRRRPVEAARVRAARGRGRGPSARGAGPGATPTARARARAGAPGGRPERAADRRPRARSAGAPSRAGPGSRRADRRRAGRHRAIDERDRREPSRRPRARSDDLERSRDRSGAAPAGRGRAPAGRPMDAVRAARSSNAGRSPTAGEGSRSRWRLARASGVECSPSVSTTPSVAWPGTSEERATGRRAPAPPRGGALAAGRSLERAGRRPRWSGSSELLDGSAARSREQRRLRPGGWGTARRPAHRAAAEAERQLDELQATGAPGSTWSWPRSPCAPPRSPRRCGASSVRARGGGRGTVPGAARGLRTGDPCPGADQRSWPRSARSTRWPWRSWRARGAAPPRGPGRGRATARRELHQVIRALDDEIMRVFAPAFADVNEHFQALVATLFPGGPAGSCSPTPKTSSTPASRSRLAPPGKRAQVFAASRGASAPSWPSRSSSPSSAAGPRPST